MDKLKAKLLALGLAGAIALVPVYEGIRLKVYKDPVGISTDCIGHTGADVRAVNTLEQCYDKFYKDLETASATVLQCVRVPLQPSEMSAYTSFAFNVGPGGKGVKDGFCVLKNGRTPSFLTNLNKGYHISACEGLLQWVHPDLPGIRARRTSEYKLCIKDLNGSANN